MIETALVEPPRHSVMIDPAPMPADPLVEVVIPIYNEAAILATSVRRVQAYLRDRLPFPTHLTIADNASTDESPAIGAALAAELADVSYLRLERKGRGLALRDAWSQSQSRVVAYMDVDLSTDLTALWPLVAPLLSGHSEVSIGSRLARGAQVTRGPKRELISRSYNLILRRALHARFSDAQCGFKAVRRDALLELLPQVGDNAWFFDTELLVLAQRAGMRIHEVPVDWVDDPDSRVDIVSTAMADLHGVWRIRRRPSRRTTQTACWLRRSSVSGRNGTGGGINVARGQSASVRPACFNASSQSESTLQSRSRPAGVMDARKIVTE
jgi:glycosyltransferase involved in cell wall biosynthesis